MFENEEYEELLEGDVWTTPEYVPTDILDSLDNVKVTSLPKHISKKQLQFSRKANRLIEQEVFPKLYGKMFHFEDVCMDTNGPSERYCTLDAELSVDYKGQVRDPKDQFGYADTKLIQVRAQQHTDFTVTISIFYNGKPCEWYNLDHLSCFIWGFYDEKTNTLTDWIAVKELKRLRDLIRMKKIQAWDRVNKRNGQRFYSINIEDMEKHGLIWERKENPLH